jgi:hypothetical protein
VYGEPGSAVAFQVMGLNRFIPIPMKNIGPGARNEKPESVRALPGK